MSAVFAYEFHIWGHTQKNGNHTFHATRSAENVDEAIGLVIADMALAFGVPDHEIIVDRITVLT